MVGGVPGRRDQARFQTRLRLRADRPEVQHEEYAVGGRATAGGAGVPGQRGSRGQGVGRRLCGGSGWHGGALQPLGVIPKKGKPGRWRLILDLSAPEGVSVNDGIPKDLCGLGYMSVDDLVAQVLRLGQGAEMAKIDVRQAYRNVPVHPRDRHLLGMEWHGRVLVEGALPFGLRSAPLLFTALGDAVQWAVEQEGVSWAGHYIDDFVTIGGPGSGECEWNLKKLKAVCTRLGLPLEEEKEEGPAAVITFLGMELDSMKLQIRLPGEKLGEMRATLRSWRGMKSCRKRDLLSVIGVLSHASKAIRAGRSFTRRLIDLSTTVKRLDRRVRLNQTARADIEWWWQFSRRWNGVAMMVAVNRRAPECDVVSDASGSWGCGAVFRGQWFQLEWKGLGATQGYGIMAKELFPIVVAAAVWGPEWAGKTVRARCDNQAVVATVNVATVNSGSCREAEAMHLRRCLAFLEVRGASTWWGNTLGGWTMWLLTPFPGTRLSWHVRYCRGQRGCRWKYQTVSWTWWQGPSRSRGTTTGRGCGTLPPQRGGRVHPTDVHGGLVQVREVLRG